VPLFDQVTERVEIVEQRVRVDFALEREQLRFDVAALQALAALRDRSPLL
jgi:hypothetical protein